MEKRNASMVKEKKKKLKRKEMFKVTYQKAKIWTQLENPKSSTVASWSPIKKQKKPNKSSFSIALFTEKEFEYGKDMVLELREINIGKK